MTGESRDENEQSVALGRTVGVGCFTFFVGAWSGGIVAVLVGKIVEGMKESPTCEGLPVCNWYVYAGVGAVIGALTLPVLVLNRLKRSRKAADNSRG